MLYMISVVRSAEGSNAPRWCMASSIDFGLHDARADDQKSDGRCGHSCRNSICGSWRHHGGRDLLAGRSTSCCRKTARLATLRGKIDERTSLEKIVSEQRETNRRPFLQKQLELCFEATDAASRLALETNPTEWEKSRFTFWRLYWGILGIVEDQGVASAMVQLGQLVPQTPSNPPQLPMSSLQRPALTLAHAARDLMRRSWDVDLQNIDLKAR
jgi:hypothetical protein